MPTVQQAIDRFQEIYPDCDDTTALRLYNNALRKLIVRLKLRSASQTVSLTSGTREYDLPSGAVKSHAAYYIRSASDGDFFPLTETSVEELDSRDAGWRERANTSSTEPRLYYTSSAVDSDSSKFQIGFVEKPPTTTSAGYPNVTLYTTRLAEMDVTDNIPADVLDEEIFISAMAEMWAIREHRDEAEYWRERHRRDFDENVVYVKSMSGHTNFEIRYPHVGSMGRVV